MIALLVGEHAPAVRVGVVANHGGLAPPDATVHRQVVRLEWVLVAGVTPDLGLLTRQGARYTYTVASSMTNL